MFSIVNQLMALNCLPPLRVVHTSKSHHGQIYIPEVGPCMQHSTLSSLSFSCQTQKHCGHALKTCCWQVNYCIMVLTIGVVLGFRDSVHLSSAYGVSTASPQICRVCCALWALSLQGFSVWFALQIILPRLLDVCMQGWR